MPEHKSKNVIVDYKKQLQDDIEPKGQSIDY